MHSKIEIANLVAFVVYGLIATLWAAIWYTPGIAYGTFFLVLIPLGTIFYSRRITESWIGYHSNVAQTLLILFCWFFALIILIMSNTSYNKHLLFGHVIFDVNFHSHVIR